MSYLIGHCTIEMSKSNQSVHGFWICTVNDNSTKLRMMSFAHLVTSRFHQIQTTSQALVRPVCNAVPKMQHFQLLVCFYLILSPASLDHCFSSGLIWLDCRDLPTMKAQGKNKILNSTNCPMNKCSSDCPCLLLIIPGFVLISQLRNKIVKKHFDF